MKYCIIFTHELEITSQHLFLSRVASILGRDLVLTMRESSTL